MRWIQNWLFPITLLAFMGPVVKYLDILFSTNTRWVLLVLLSVHVVFSSLKSRQFDGFVYLLFLYCVWCVLTTLWSEAFRLSLMKSGAFCLVTFTMFFAGKTWIDRKGVAKGFNYLMPVALITMMAAGLGHYSNPRAYDNIYSSNPLYQGFVHGPNMLGSLVAISIPWVVWQVYSARRQKRKRNLYLLLVGFFLVFLVMSKARASFLAVAFTGGGILFLLSTKRLIRYSYLAVLLMICIYLWGPHYAANIKHRYIYKTSDSIFYTRERVWEESLEQAKKGGWFGGGYGVTIGAGAWQRMLTSVGYGREKGNSQLAIVEEIGIVGFVLYLIIIFAVMKRIYSGFLRASDPRNRFAIVLALGAIVGMLAQSVFEAWWVAPGAPESAAFWALTGIGFGMAGQKESQAAGETASFGKGYSPVAKLRAQKTQPGVQARSR